MIHFFGEFQQKISKFFLTDKHEFLWLLIKNFSDPTNDTIAQYVLKSIFDENYNKNMVPSKNGPTAVTIEFVIQSIAQVSEITSSFTLDLLFR